jgi:alkanesulfonate monooxygenase SsuD/methylene tetrahydromethanopterin reductase-like flavin-dependent oxidoreductase (luciferase family)
MLEEVLACAAIGAPDTVASSLRSLVTATGADELILTAQIYDHAARVRSFEIVAGLRDRIG